MVEKMPETDMTRVQCWRTEPASDDRGGRPDARVWPVQANEKKFEHKEVPRYLEEGQEGGTPMVAVMMVGKDETTRLLLVECTGRSGACARISLIATSCLASEAAQPHTFSLSPP